MAVADDLGISDLRESPVSLLDTNFLRSCFNLQNVVIIFTMSQPWSPDYTDSELEEIQRIVDEVYETVNTLLFFITIITFTEQCFMVCCFD